MPKQQTCSSLRESATPSKTCHIPSSRLIKPIKKELDQSHEYEYEVCGGEGDHSACTIST